MALTDKRFDKNAFDEVTESSFFDNRKCFIPKVIPKMSFEDALAAIRSDDWAKRSIHEQAGIAQVVANNVAEELGIEPVVVSVNMRGGNPAAARHEIRLVPEGLKKQRLVEDIAHEVFHSYQYQCLGGVVMGANPTEMQLWDMSPSIPKQGLEYNNSFREVGARVYGWEFAECHGFPATRELYEKFRKWDILVAKAALALGIKRFGAEDDMAKSEKIYDLYKEECAKSLEEVCKFPAISVGDSARTKATIEKLVEMNPEVEFDVPKMGNIAKIKVDVPIDELKLPEDFYRDGDAITNIENCPKARDGVPYHVVRIAIEGREREREKMGGKMAEVKGVEKAPEIGLDEIIKGRLR